MSAVSQVFEGTWEEIVRHAHELAGRKVRLEVLDAESEPPAANSSAPKNLAELLGDYIGAVEGNGEALSEETSQRFGEYIARKHHEGRL